MTAKSRKAIIILSAVLAVLIAAGILTVTLPRLSKGGDENAPLCGISSPTGLSWSGSGTDECSFTLDGGVWYYTENRDYPIKQSSFTQIVSSLSDLTPTRTFTPTEALSSYGLDPAEHTLTARDKSGNEFTLYIGSLAGAKLCYAMTGNSDDIYVIPYDLQDLLADSVYEMIDGETFSAPSASDITALKITQGDISASFTKDDGGWYYLTESGEYVPEEEFSAVGSDGEEHTARKYLNDIEAALSSLRSSGCCGYLCTDEELDSMGLGTSALTAEFTMSDGSVKAYIIGGEFSDDTGGMYYYFTAPGLSGVYKMTSAAASPLFEAVSALGR